MTQTKSASAELFAQHTQDYEAIQEYLKRDDAVGRFARMYDTGYFCWLNRLLFDRDGLRSTRFLLGTLYASTPQGGAVVNLGLVTICGMPILLSTAHNQLYFNSDDTRTAHLVADYKILDILKEYRVLGKDVDSTTNISRVPSLDMFVQLCEFWYSKHVYHVYLELVKNGISPEDKQKCLGNPYLAPLITGAPHREYHNTWTAAQ